MFTEEIAIRGPGIHQSKWANSERIGRELRGKDTSSMTIKIRVKAYDQGSNGSETLVPHEETKVFVCSFFFLITIKPSTDF